MSWVLLGLDIGTTHCKALLLDRSGAEVAMVSASTPFASEGGRIEMAVDHLLGGVAGLVAGLGPARDGVAGVGIAGMAECGAPLDAHGHPLAPVISWHDPRGEDVVADLAAALGDSLALRTGQRLRPVSSVAKLGWLVRHGTGPVQHWLGVPELCLWALTGVQATEHSLASRTGCYDILERRWLDEVCQAAGFSAACLPVVSPAGTPMGAVTGGAARAWGLPAGIPVTLAGHDHLSGAVGAGAGAGDLVNSVGTAETVLGQVPDAPDLAVALAQRTPVSLSPGGRAWVVLGGAARAGVILTAAAAQLGRSFADLDDLAARAGGAPDLRDILPDLQSGRPTRLPADSPGRIWLGLLRALSERTAETAARVAVLALGERMLVIGGGSASDPWLAEKARAVPLPIAVPVVGQAAARGAAVQAGVAARWWTSALSAPAPPARPVGPPAQPGRPVPQGRPGAGR